MTDTYFFLPSWPIAPGRFALLALLLLAAVLAGEAVRRLLRAPRLIGWVAVGYAAGPHALGLIDRDALWDARWFVDLAIGLVLFELGQRIDLGWLRRNPWLLATSLAESLLAFIAMFGVLMLVQDSALLAATAAAIGVATSPAVVLTLSRELRAQGQVAERMQLLTALNCAYAFVAIHLLFAWLHAEYDGRMALIVAHPLYLIFGSFGLAALMAAVTLGLFRRLGAHNSPSAEAQYLVMVALVVLTVSLAGALKLSVALALLSFGVLSRLFDRERRFVSLDFGRLGTILVIFLFALTAADIDPAMLAAGGLAGIALIAARYLGRAAAIFAFAQPSGLVVRKASLLALALTPMSALALMMVRETGAVYPQFGPSLAAVMISAIVVMELLGPLLVKFALDRAGESAEPPPAPGARLAAGTNPQAVPGGVR